MAPGQFAHQVVGALKGAPGERVGDVGVDDEDAHEPGQALKRERCGDAPRAHDPIPSIGAIRRNLCLGAKKIMEAAPKPGVHGRGGLERELKEMGESD